MFDKVLLRLKKESIESVESAEPTLCQGELHRHVQDRMCLTAHHSHTVST